MNDTRRDELLRKGRRAHDLHEQVAVMLDDMSLLDISDTADQVIALVTAARDAEIRELLLTHADGYIVAKGQDGEAAFATKPWMEQILNAIGLHADRAVPEPDADAVIFTCTNPECDACEAERDPFPDMTADAVERVKSAMLESVNGDMLLIDSHLDDMARAALDAAGDEPGLDDLLDSVHPDYSVYVGRGWDVITYVAEVLADDATDSEGATVIATGTGATHMEAVQNAVEAVKEATK